MYLLASLTALLGALYLAFWPTDSIVQALSWRHEQPKPNFVYILADDQSVDIATPEFMPKLAKHVTSQGINYTHVYTPLTNCCPSRAGFFLSQHGHTHNITWVMQPYGGWERFKQLGYHLDWLPVWLQNAGYQTYYSGKLMNRNTVNNCQHFSVNGFNSSDIFLDPYTYAYYNVSVSHNGGPAVSYPGQYSTGLVEKWGLDYLDRIAKSDTKEPFFIGLAPVGPHSTTNHSGNYIFDVPEVENKYWNTYDNYKIPRTASFNPDQPHGASWVKQLPKLTDEQVDYFDLFYQRRLGAVRSVDDLVEAVVKKLEETGLDKNTYIIYSGDNGYTIGSHRRQPGKSTLYESDIRIPLVIRGPGIKAGTVEEEGSFLNIDLAATINHLAGGKPGHELEGRIMPFGYENKQQTGFPFALSEFWIWGMDEGKYELKGGYANNTYRGLRLREGGRDLAYHIWCTGERELFDLKTDPEQLSNLLEASNAQGAFPQLNVKSSSIEATAARLDGALLWLKTCNGQGCADPWPHLFPSGEVKTFAQAMDPKYDVYFQHLPRVQWSFCYKRLHADLKSNAPTSVTQCEFGFHPWNELPTWTTEYRYWSGPFFSGGNATTNMAGGLKGLSREA